MRRLRAALAAVALALAAAEAGAAFVDAALAEVDGRVVTASDVALSRALGLFGFEATAAPIDGADVDRLVGAWLIVLEARRLDLPGGDEAPEAAWWAVAGRLGGEAALVRYLDAAGIGSAWAREMLEQDRAWRRFVDVRFRALVFVADADVAAALGPGDHSPEARERARARLEQAEVARRLAEWTADAMARASIRRVLGDGDTVPCPLPMPAAVPLPQ